MIKLEGVEKIYRTKEIETLALSNVNLHIDKGEFVSIMGPSGCGKSTLLNIIGLLDNPSAGKIEIMGQEVENLSDAAQAHRCFILLKKNHLMKVILQKLIASLNKNSCI